MAVPEGEISERLRAHSVHYKSHLGSHQRLDPGVRDSSSKGASVEELACNSTLAFNLTRWRRFFFFVLFIFGKG
jgi:hypothetical protein